MKIGIVYATTHGCTEKCVLKVKAGLSGEIQSFNIKKNLKPQIDGYETILIGGSIHAGRIQKFITEIQ